MKTELTVLQSFPVPRPTTNPYLVMLAEHLRACPDLVVLNFSWKSALLGRYDVFHVHWPEIMVTGGTWPKRAVRQLLFLLLLARLRLTRTPIVRTLHNIELPEGLSRFEGFLLRLFVSRTTLVIRLNARTPAPDSVLLATIVHGHYRDWYSRPSHPDAVPGRFGYTGLIRRYKGVEGLIDAFRETMDKEAGLSLLVAGNPSSDSLAEGLRELRGSDGRIELDFRFLPDEDFVTAICASELVVFPYIFMHNSGGVLAALSLDRPALVPDNEVNRALAQEVGPGWLQFFDGTPTADVLVDALNNVRTAKLQGRPDLTRRGWENAGADHLHAYRRAAASMRRRGTP
ncbi:glycosyl transferase [Arthrobacter sp. LAPM80]|uniref:glycosyl transferase n=1 Tax=Arthrobacter sp. LAPM80 TaxID=3141788 RepID=UPI00398BB34E